MRPKDVADGPTWMVKFACPTCGAKHDRATEAGDDGHSPEPGDAIICWDCGATNMLGDKGALVTMPDDRREEMFRDLPHIKTIVERLQARRR